MQNKLNYSKIALVISRFNLDITQKLYDGAITRLQELGFDAAEVTAIWVPGAIEIPITADHLARTKKYSAIICLGAVIKGETSHFDFVCQQVSYGCQKVALTYHLPVIFGVLTTATEAQAHARAGGKEGNMGRYAAESACEMITTLSEI